MAATSMNSFLVGNNTHIPTLKPKSTSQSFLHLNKQNTLNLSGKINPVVVRCVAEITHVQDGARSNSVGSQERVSNFVAGPTTLPENIVLKAQSDLYKWRGSGMNVMEMIHRGKEFLSIMQKSESVVDMFSWPVICGHH